MGFMDKVKAAGQDVAAKSKEATAQAQSKMEQAQTRKKIDEAAKQLGYLVYRERTQGTPSGSEADQLVNQMSELEGQLAATAPQTVAGTSAAPAAATGTTTEGPASTTSAAPTSSEPTSGDFKL